MSVGGKEKKGNSSVGGGDGIQKLQRTAWMRNQDKGVGLIVKRSPQTLASNTRKVKAGGITPPLAEQAADASCLSAPLTWRLQSPPSTYLICLCNSPVSFSDAWPGELKHLTWQVLPIPTTTSRGNLRADTSPAGFTSAGRKQWADLMQAEGSEAQNLLSNLLKLVQTFSTSLLVPTS